MLSKLAYCGSAAEKSKDVIWKIYLTTLKCNGYECKVKFFQHLVKSYGIGRNINFIVLTETSCRKEYTYII